MGTVTGSKFLLEAGGTRILVDCGLYQGLKQLRLRNWKRLPFDPASLDGVVLTHAHIDHSGYLPALVRDGFRGPILCTPPTRDLCDILLPDSGRIQEEDAAYANRKRFSRHHPALPLYTEEDARRVPPLMQPLRFDEETRLGAFRVRLQRAGHILGAASAHVSDGQRSVLFSGDLGRSNDLLMHAPTPPRESDFIVVESTYGDRLHPEVDPAEAIAETLRRTTDRGGILLLPSFAVGRAQTLLYLLHQIFERKLAERVPVFVNSPMATNVTDLYRRYSEYHRLSETQCEAVCDVAEFVQSVEESKALNERRSPMVIVAASGMATGGRVLHHLRALLPDARNTVALPGFQAAGTRGAALAAGAKAVKIHGAQVPVRAEVVQLNLLSAHADQADLLAWLGAAPRPPRRVFVVHGEPTAADTLRHEAAERGLVAVVPEHAEAHALR